MFSAKHNLIAGGYLADSEGGGGLVEGVDPDQAVLGGGAGQQHQQHGQHGNTETQVYTGHKYSSQYQLKQIAYAYQIYYAREEVHFSALETLAKEGGVCFTILLSFNRILFYLVVAVSILFRIWNNSLINPF